MKLLNFLRIRNYKEVNSISFPNFYQRRVFADLESRFYAVSLYVCDKTHKCVCFVSEVDGTLVGTVGQNKARMQQLAGVDSASIAKRKKQADERRDQYEESIRFKTWREDRKREKQNYGAK